MSLSLPMWDNPTFHQLKLLKLNVGNNLAQLDLMIQLKVFMKWLIDVMVWHIKTNYFSINVVGFLKSYDHFAGFHISLDIT